MCYGPWGVKELDTTERLNSNWHLSGKGSTGNAGDVHFIPGLERSPGEGSGNQHQYSCLGNPTDREGWQAKVHRITKDSDIT